MDTDRAACTAPHGVTLTVRAESPLAVTVCSAWMMIIPPAPPCALPAPGAPGGSKTP